MKHLRKDIAHFPEVWRVKFFGTWYGNKHTEGIHTITVVAPRMEDALAAIRKQVDKTAVMQSATMLTACFSDKCFHPNDSLSGIPEPQE